ncbi:MAG: nuclear transport factor 2 family protein [Phycisphaerales bacterium]
MNTKALASLVGLSSMALLASCATSRECCENEAAEDAAEVASVEHARDAFLASWTKTEGKPFTTDALSQSVDNSGAFLSFDGMSQGKTVIQGWNEYSGMWGPGMNGFTKASLTQTKSLRVWVDDDVAATCSIVRVYGEMPNGQKLDMPGHLTLVFHRDGERKPWKVVHEHMSLNVKE